MSFKRLLVPLVAFALVIAACSDDATTDNSTRDDSGTIVEGGDVGVFVLKVGDCFNQSTEADAISDVPGVPCDEPHDVQIYAAFDLADGDWPGLDSVEMDAALGCLERFEAAIGEPYETSPIDIFPMYPLEDGWNGLDDREVLCGGYNVDGSKLTADLLG